MIALDVFVDGDACWPDLTERGFVEGRWVGIAALSHGTVSGKPTVTVRIDLPDGQTVLAETTLALFQGAAAAFRGRYGEGGER